MMVISGVKNWENEMQKKAEAAVNRCLEREREKKGHFITLVQL